RECASNLDVRSEAFRRSSTTAPTWPLQPVAPAIRWALPRLPWTTTATTPPSRSRAHSSLQVRRPSRTAGKISRSMAASASAKRLPPIGCSSARAFSFNSQAVWKPRCRASRAIRRRSTPGPCSTTSSPVARRGELVTSTKDVLPTFETIALEREDRLLTITLNRPAALNAFNEQMHRDAVDVFAFASEDEHSDVLLLTGAGRAL